MDPPTWFNIYKINPFLLTDDNNKMERAIHSILKENNNKPIISNAILDLTPPNGVNYTVYIMNTGNQAVCSIQVGKHTAERLKQAQVNLEAQLPNLFTGSQEVILIQDRNSLVNRGGINIFFRENKPFILRILVPRIFNPANVIKNMMLDIMKIYGRSNDEWPALNLPFIRMVFAQAVRKISANADLVKVLNLNVSKYLRNLTHIMKYRDDYFAQLDEDEQDMLELEADERAVAEANGLVVELDL